MKICPFCGEEIQDSAVVCRYCQRDLCPAAKPSQQLGCAEVAIALLIPIIGVIMGLVMLAKGETREKGIAAILVSIVAWILWAAVWGALSGY